MKIKTVQISRKPRPTRADALRATLDKKHTAVLVRRRENIGGYHALLKLEGLRVRYKKVRGGWAAWVEQREGKKR